MARPLEHGSAQGHREPPREGEGDRTLFARRFADDRRHLPCRPGDRRHRLLQVRRLGRADGEAGLRRVHENRRLQPISPAEAAGRAVPLMENVDLVDRSSLLKGLYQQLSLRAEETAMVTIDMHRGHLDMEVATMPAQPEDAKRVIGHARQALDFARKARMPVIHVVLVYRRLPGIGSEGMRSHFWKALHAAQGHTDRLTTARRSTVR